MELEHHRINGIQIRLTVIKEALRLLWLQVLRLIRLRLLLELPITIVLSL